MDSKVVLLHKEKKYLDFCCEILNAEWPRSVGARMHTLESSCDEFPTSFVLILCHEKDEPVGHARVSLIPRETSACFIESVIIRPDLRGKGYGKKLMLLVEDYVSKKGIKTSYLSTIDQQVFYERTGYIYSEPVSIWGGPAKPCIQKQNAGLITEEVKLDKDTGESKIENHGPSRTFAKSGLASLQSAIENFSFKEKVRNPPVIERVIGKKIFMKKELVPSSSRV